MGSRRWNLQTLVVCAAALTVMVIVYQTIHPGRLDSGTQLHRKAVQSASWRRNVINERVAAEIEAIESQLLMQERLVPQAISTQERAPTKQNDQEGSKGDSTKQDIDNTRNTVVMPQNTFNYRFSLNYINESFPLLLKLGSKTPTHTIKTAKKQSRDSRQDMGPRNRQKHVAVPNELSESKTDVKIIIHAKYRTGSTFTGEYFIRHHDIAYMFEPLKYGVGPEFIVKDGQTLLWNLLNCAINTNETLRIKESWLRGHVFSHIANQTPGYARKEHVPLSEAERYCKSVHNKAIKTIRIENVWELEDFMKKGVKVVHLIRDPRGVMHSRKQLRKVHLRADAKKYCHDALNDIQFMFNLPEAKYNLFKNYHVVRYEDLAVQPRKEMETLYKFLGITPDASLLAWIKSVEDATVSGELTNAGFAFGTARSNPAYTALAWRELIEMNDTYSIQDECQQFMKLAGYRPVYVEQELRNMSIPILD